ncbi:MAG: DUF1501 domain-containing protein [Bacteroidetes bacterium]|nr:DUF1501 domain-containing protein [Bacteroidota bacterium]MDA1122405.1 DUF1501 domain-containing protein [Bacteroidota bacterium]
MSHIDCPEELNPVQMSRRHFLSSAGSGIGVAALSSLLPGCLGSSQSSISIAGNSLLPHFAPRAKRVIYLFQSGGPAQMELYDYKPMLREREGEDLPASVRMGQRLTGMTANQAAFPLKSANWEFRQHGQSGAWVSDILPHIGKISDDLCFIKTLHTEAINHDPAMTFFQTGSQQSGRPSMGSWLSYGLGTDNDNLPAYCVLLSKGTGRVAAAQPLASRLWGTGFLPSLHQGVQFRSGKDPVLYLSNPDGITGGDRRKMLDYLGELNQLYHAEVKDPEVRTRIAQYEMAYRMQTSVPEVMDVSGEPESIYELYGPESRIPGTYAANCLLARRLAERDVKFIQLYHQGWDHHNDLPDHLAKQCRDTDQASAALVSDLKRRGLLEDTLVIWGGEFGRTNYSQGLNVGERYGRDHHPRCFTAWMAGGGVKPGISYGQTDEFGYNVIENPVHVHDFQATILHLMGIDHEQLIFKHQGRRYRLTDVHGNVVKDILA